MSHSPQLLKQIVEGALLAAGEALSLERLAELFQEHERPTRRELRSALQALQQECSERGFELVEVASGYRFQVRQSLSPWVSRLWQERPQRYSRALLETLALIAYRQPITRGDIEDIRGVSVSSSIIRTLLEREWIRVVGHRDVPGRPAMYATTRRFLDYFNLKTLDELPSLLEVRDLAEIEAALNQEVPPSPETTSSQPAALGEPAVADQEAKAVPAAEPEPASALTPPDEAGEAPELDGMAREIETLVPDGPEDSGAAASADSEAATEEAVLDDERNEDENWFPPSLTFSDLNTRWEERRQQETADTQPAADEEDSDTSR